ncbi:MAG: DUF420 domain-containing protein [Myxococcota bacterium]|nr:DUF420 domain-containing protein [Myxococcota bacterium]
MAAQSPVQLVALKGVSPRRAVFVILLGSLAAVALLVVVIYGHRRATEVPRWTGWLPTLNAFLNATSAVFLVLAYRLRRTDAAGHARRMLVALASSSLFLVSYIIYHSVHGDTKFGGQGLVRPLYFFVLVTHVALSAVVLPLIFSSFFFSLSGRIRQHRKVSRYTLPIWLYVSVTGVLVFALLRAYA